MCEARCAGISDAATPAQTTTKIAPVIVTASAAKTPKSSDFSQRPSTMPSNVPIPTPIRERPPPFPDPDRVVMVSERAVQFPILSVSWQNYRDWQAQSTSFEEFGATRVFTICAHW